jgi:hypothetical protein
VVAGVVDVNDLIADHVSLEVECLDRIYLNGYVPTLQVGGQVVSFMTQHLGYPVPSPALFNQLGRRFRAAVDRFALDNDIPVVRFGKDDRKADVMRRYLRAAERSDRPGVVAIGVAQEFQSVFAAADRNKGKGPPLFGFYKADRRVSVYYFYIWDREFGPGFVKICTYFPYPIKVWLNGHAWAARQCQRAGIDYEPLEDNGFQSCADPEALQRICDHLGPNQILSWFERWMRVLPTPLSDTDRAAGYWWELSMRQIEISRTLVFDAPRKARAFFEALVTDNLAVGRPDVIQLIFARQVRSTTRGTFSTKVVNRGVEVVVNAFYKHSRIKEYLKDGRALRIECVINSPTDLGCQRRLHNLGDLQAKARQANRRILSIQQAGQGCAIDTELFERVSLPYIREGQRTGALRFGEPRAMALAGALCCLIGTVTGVTNRTLRGLVAGLLDTAYSPNQMSYDLRRLRLRGLIDRIPGTNTYTITPDGIRWAVFTTKIHDRVLRPLHAANKPPAPPALRQALATIDRHVNSYIAGARLKPAA